jgi:hypothetical protein
MHEPLQYFHLEDNLCYYSTIAVDRFMLII